MKAERRHELQHNELADWVGHSLEGIRPYWRLIVAALVLVVGGIAVMGLLSRQATSQQEVAWAQYLKAVSNNDLPALVQVGEQYAGTTASTLAFQRVGDGSLAEGTQLLFSDRAAAMEKLEEASKAYEFVASHARDPLLRQRGAIGRAQALEAANKLPEAREQYEMVIERWPDSVVAQLATERLESLQDASTGEFYTWFFAQTPKPKPSTSSGSTTGDDINYLPLTPNMDLPSASEASSATPDGQDARPSTSLDDFDFGQPGGPTTQPPVGVDEIDFGPTEPSATGTETPAAESDTSNQPGTPSSQDASAEDSGAGEPSSDPDVE